MGPPGFRPGHIRRITVTISATLGLSVSPALPVIVLWFINRDPAFQSEVSRL